MYRNTNHTPCGGAPEAAIIALERRAPERWNQGDPDGFLELTSGDVVYFDPALGRKLIGKKPSESTTARSGAKSGSTRTGWSTPSCGCRRALPSWHTITRPSGTGRCSGCTARKFTRPQRPAVGRSYIRTGLSPGRTIEAVRRAGYSPCGGLECKLHGTGHGKKNR